jgi:hypothetical protein
MKEKDAFDDLFGDDLPSTHIDETVVKSETSIPEKVEKVEKVEEVKVKVDDSPVLLTEEKNVYPILMGSEKFPEDYKNLYNRIIDQYSLLPRINYDEIYKEIASLSVKSCPTPSLSDLNSELEKVQSSKDRLCEIFIDVLKSYTFKKRAVDIIRDSWLKFAGGKAEGKNESIRKGEAVYISSDFEQDLAQSEALIQSCKHIIKNLDSLTENLSRRITIIQLQVKVQDIGRGMSPDFIFDKRASADVSLSEMAEEIDIGESKEKLE